MPTPKKLNKNAKKDALTHIKPQFQVDLPIFVEFERSGERQKAKSQIIGWRDNTFLIINTPEVDGRKVMHQTKNNMVIRYLHEGSVYGFVSELLGVHRSQPADLWFLEFPEMAEAKNLRRSRRVRTYLDAEVSDGGKCKILNLSSLGALVMADRGAPVGSEIALTFRLPNNTEIQQLRAIVRRLETVNGGIAMGLEFHAEETKKHEVIEEYVSAYLSIHQDI